MSYTEKIVEAKNVLKILKEDFLKQKKIVSELKIGDTVYEEGTHGGWDMEYYPQVILDIDYKNAKLFVHEKSMNKSKWVYGFHVKDTEKEKFIYH